MFEVIETIRKTNVLKRPTLPCLSKYYTINLLAGCPYQCGYCYTQAFRSHPGWGKVTFYANTLDLLQVRLPRMRRKPDLVYFSTACEPFVPHGQILQSLYGIMQLLLESSASILISTKSLIPTKFVELFYRHRGQVHVQVGLTTVDDQKRQLLEQRAPSISDRLQNLRALLDNHIACEVRADPLIPELTDTEQNIQNLFKSIADHGARRVITSYLFLRRANYGPLSQLKSTAWSFREMSDRLYTRKIERYCGSSTIRLPEMEYRKSRFQQFRHIADQYGLALGLCRCKNPDVTDQCCHPQLPLQARDHSRPHYAGQTTFPFTC